jgi:transaldolase
LRTGYLGARTLAQAGIPVNFTLGFSARHNYLAALLTQPAFCNVFMGRLNSVVADNQLGSGDNVGEKTTLATQRELLALRNAARTNTRLIGASVRNGAQIGALAGVDVLTMPTKAAAEYRAKPLAVVRSRVEDDPPVDFAAGAALWTVSRPFKDAVETVLKKADTLTPDELQAMLPPDFLPRWSEADVATARRDGKIPVWAKWRSRLESGEIGLDALMNLSALQSFATDQAALDDRIRSVLKNA